MERSRQESDTFSFRNRVDYDRRIAIRLENEKCKKYMLSKNYTIKLIVKVYDPENKISDIFQILHKIMMWDQEGVILRKEIIDTEYSFRQKEMDEDVKIFKITIYTPLNIKSIFLFLKELNIEIELKEKPYDTTEMIDAYISFEEYKL